MAVWHNIGLQTSRLFGSCALQRACPQGAVIAPCGASACAGGPAGVCLHGTAAVLGPMGIVQV